MKLRPFEIVFVALMAPYYGMVLFGVAYYWRDNGHSFGAWLCWLLFACLPVVMWMGRSRAGSRRLRRIRTSNCPRCGYDLRASSVRCPECGSPIAPGAIRRSAVASASQSGARPLR